MKQLPFALFDMDGTLVDSMGYWREAPLKYALEVFPDLTEEQKDMVRNTYTYEGMQALFATFGVEMTVDEVMHASEALMVEHYRDHIDAKPGVTALMEEFRARGVKMGLVTMTPHSEVDICLRRTGLDKYMSFALTPEDTSDGSGKEKPEIFGIALRKLGCGDPAECMFFEDSIYAASTAKKLGFYLVGVYDRWTDHEEVAAIADTFLHFD